MIYGSVCSGIEAATAAWKPLGWECSFVSEIDTFPSAVLAHHYPEILNHGDFTQIGRSGGPEPTDAIQLLVGGTPCQSFSVAGLRKGMDDPRGNLALEYLALADRLRPEWLVWENVPGVLSSTSHDAPDPRPPENHVGLVRDGTEVVVEDEYVAEEVHAFNCFLAGLSELGYGFAYRVLDAQYFGLAQRRKRVFVVGYLGDWRRAAAVLFESESLSGHPAPSREAGTEAPATLRGGASGGRSHGKLNSSDRMPMVAWPVTTDPYSDNGGGEDVLVPDVAGPIGSATSGSGYRTTDLDGHGAHITHALRREGFDPSEDGTGRGTPLVIDEGNGIVSEQVGTLKGDAGAKGNRGFCVAFHENQRGEVTTNDTAGAINSGGGKPGQGYTAIAFESRFARNGRGAPSDIVPPLKAESGQTGKGAGAPLVAGTLAASGAGTARACGNNNQKDMLVPTQMAVRRLTPRECERLQGFPDDFTLIPNYRAKMRAHEIEEMAAYLGIAIDEAHEIGATPDGPRYRALGNSMAVPVMRWIGGRIQMVEDLLETNH